MRDMRSVDGVGKDSRMFWTVGGGVWNCGSWVMFVEVEVEVEGVIAVAVLSGRRWYTRTGIAVLISL